MTCRVGWIVDRRGFGGAASAAAVCGLAVVIAGFCAPATSAQTRAVRVLVRPAEAPPPESAGEAPAAARADAPGAAGEAATPPAAAATQAALSEEEIAELRAIYDGLSFDDQQSMKAYYADMGVALDDVLGITAQQAAEAARTQQILEAIRGMDFSRRPQAVLAARSRLGFGHVAQPDAATAAPREVALWIQLNALAGEWEVLGAMLRQRPKSEAGAVYGALLQSLSQGEQGMLPEEVLLLAEACPGEPQEQNLASLSQLLRSSAQKHSTHVLLERINRGTRVFGRQDAQQRRRTVEFLSNAGLVIEAYDFLPALDEARAAGDASLILVHARYKESLAEKQIPGPQADAFRQDAWDLFCEASRLPRATLAEIREALTHNIGMMSLLPRVKVTPWLEEMFASPVIGPVALEVLTIKADAIGNEQLPEDQRAEAVVLMKECVDVMLARNTLEGSSLVVPLRMLTRALLAEMEGLGEKKQQDQRRWQVTYDAQVMLRAIPDARWLDAIEPSLATRVTKAGMTIALQAKELDNALSLLRDGLQRTPSQASDLADHFLQVWARELAPREDQRAYPYWYWYSFRPAAPVTRGKQRRRLEKLHELLQTLATADVDPRTLPSVVQAFQACYSSTEAYTRDDIERVFGPLDQIPPSTCVTLARTMAQNLNGEWRNREAQQKKGVKRSDAEIARMVDKGYALAIDLMDTAIAADPESWRDNAIKAGLTYDRMQYRNIRTLLKPEEQNEYRRAAFTAFEQAALRYARAVSSGEEREDVDVYTQWFGAALGTPQLNLLRVDDMPGEGSLSDDQIDHIRRAILALPPDSAFRHISSFAQAVSDAVGRADPEVKPRLVKQALRIIGDHPAGASLRALNELYHDLVKDEIKLRLTIDGEDRVAVGKPFGVLVSLRYTNAVERETGGFAKYLQNGYYGLVGTTWREINYRDLFQKDLETALSQSFTIEALSFFDAFMPANAVRENGEDGWLEKPLAYVILSRLDSTTDRLPPVTLDMQFNDDTGPVTLVMPSNTPALAITGEAAPRPNRDLEITQIVDVREAAHREKDKAVRLEVVMKGKGVPPDVRDALEGLDDAMPGYEIAADGIETQPAVILPTGTPSTSGRFSFGGPPNQPPEEGYPLPDENGMYRLPTEKTWTVVYKPVGDPVSGSFRLPTLKSGLEAKLDSRRYADFDVVPVEGSTVPLHVRWPWWRWVIAAAGALAAIGLLVWGLRRRRERRPQHAEPRFALPGRLTPLSTILTLQRYQAECVPRLDLATREELGREIRDVERRYFGRGATEPGDRELVAVLERWLGTDRR